MLAETVDTAPLPVERDLPHLSGTGAALRRVFAAHFLRDFLHVLKIGGHPCRVRHIPRKFQEVDYDYASGTYGLVLLGYSLKPFGSRDPLGELLFSLIENAKVVVIDYAPALERGASQVPQIVNRPSLRIRTTVDLRLHDPEIAQTPYADRRLYVIDPPSSDKSM